MAYSYQNFTGTGAQATFTFSSIDGFLSPSHLYIYVDSVLKTANTHYTINGSSKTVTFTAGNIPVAGSNVRVQRITPKGVIDRPVDFTDGSILTAADLDNSALQLLYISQEAAESGAAAMGPTQTGTEWDAGNKRLSNVANPLQGQDAVTKVYVDQLALYGGVSSNPQSWTLTAVNGQQQYTLPSPAPLNLNKEFFIVMVGGVVQPTDNYSFTVSGLNYYLNFPATVANAIDIPGTGSVKIIIRNFGTTRVANTGSVGTTSLSDEAVTSAKLAAGAVNSAALGTSAVTTTKIADDAVTVDKIANDAVTADQIAAGAVGTTELANNSVTGIKLGPTAVVDSLGYTPVGTSGTYSAMGGTYNVTGTLSVPNPTNNTHATNKAYVDSVAGPAPQYTDYGHVALQGGQVVARLIDASTLTIGKLYAYRVSTIAYGGGSGPVNHYAYVAVDAGETCLVMYGYNSGMSAAYVTVGPATQDVVRSTTSSGMSATVTYGWVMRIT